MATKLDWSRLNDPVYLTEVLILKTHPCPQCGKETPNKNSQNKPKKYCSRSCKNLASVARLYLCSKKFRDSQRDNSKARKKILERNGLCVECSTPVTRGIRCQDCNQKRADSFRGHYGSV